MEKLKDKRHEMSLTKSVKGILELLRHLAHLSQIKASPRRHAPLNLVLGERGAGAGQDRPFWGSVHVHGSNGHLASWQKDSHRLVRMVDQVVHGHEGRAVGDIRLAIGAIVGLNGRLLPVIQVVVHLSVHGAGRDGDRHVRFLKKKKIPKAS